MAHLHIILTEEAPVPTSGYSQALLHGSLACDIRLSRHCA